MQFVIILILFLAINVYIAFRIFGFVRAIFPKAKKIVFIPIYMLFPALFFLGRLLPLSNFTDLINLISAYWMGVLLYTILVIVFLDLFRLILKIAGIPGKGKKYDRKTKLIAGGVATALVITIVAYGTIHAGQVQVQHHNFDIGKTAKTGKMQVVVLSDIHLGSAIDSKKIERIVTAINKQKPDMVCVVGDVFDSSVYRVEKRGEYAKLFAGIKSKYGVYVCLGNHDSSAYAESEERAEYYQFIKEAGWVPMDDQIKLINNDFYVAGRIDEAPISRNRRGVQRKTIEELVKNTDPKRPIIMLDHQPRELSQARQAGVDLILSGHTHYGQVFPGTFIIDRIYDNGYGLKTFGDLYSLTTSGIGVWGPPIRVGTDSEIVVLNVSFGNQ